MQSDTRGGLEIFWRQTGHGNRDALLIHCSLGRSGAWKAVSAELSDLLTMTAFDLPGHGRSAPWREGEEIQSQVVSVVKDFVATPTDLIGHSFGATVALRFAVENPGLVRSLTLIEPVFIAAGLAENPELRAEHGAFVAALSAALAQGDRAAAARLFHEAWSNEGAWESLPPELRAEMERLIDIVVLSEPALHDDCAGLLAPGRLDKVTAPVLIIEGGRTHPLMHHICTGLERRLPRARRAVLKQAGHMAPITHPDLVAQLLRGFLSEAS